MPDILKWNIWRTGAVKQAKYLMSPPLDSQKLVYVSEAGTISMELLPIFTGHINALVKKAWIVLHNLKFQVFKEGELAQDEQVLLISERSYIPLDPNETMTEDDIKELTPLDDIAELRYDEKLYDMSKNEPETDLATKIINFNIVIIVICLIINLIQKWVG